MLLPGLSVGYCTISVTVGLSKIVPPMPGYDESLPIIYTRDQIASILGAAGPYMHLAIGLALKCGLGEQQICSLEWADIHRQDKVLRVSSKPAYGFRVKDSEQRNIPPPDDLLAKPLTYSFRDPLRRAAFHRIPNLPQIHLLRLCVNVSQWNGPSVLHVIPGDCLARNDQRVSNWPSTTISCLASALGPSSVSALT